MKVKGARELAVSLSNLLSSHRYSNNWKDLTQNDFSYPLLGLLYIASVEGSPLTIGQIGHFAFLYFFLLTSNCV